MENSNASNTSTASDDSDNGNNEANSLDELGNDAEGVWSADIEQSFQEALAIYPPCGRRKIILSEEGKMYGRNELIARYIKLRTGKTRSRKQVSSHIQVLARRKSKEIQSQLKDQSTKEKVLQSLSGMSSSQIVSASALHNKSMVGSSVSLAQISGNLHRDGAGYSDYAAQLWNAGPIPQDIRAPYLSPGYPMEKPLAPIQPAEPTPPPAWQGRSIAGPKLRLVEFSAFVEQPQESDVNLQYSNQHLFVHIGNSLTYADPLLESLDIGQIADKFPNKKGGLNELYDKGPQAAFFLVKFWADISTNMSSESGCFYGITSVYEGVTDMPIHCSTKVCSFGKQVVEKVETEYSQLENCRYVYRIERSPMCEYLINFIQKLKTLPEKYMMNSVLENFTILQVVSHRETEETLLCIAYVFEVSSSEHGAQHTIYRLMKE